MKYRNCTEKVEFLYFLRYTYRKKMYWGDYVTVKIMVSIQKGGQAKTITTAIMAEIMAEAGYNVLVIDLDSQGNATQMLTQQSIYEFSEKTVLEAIKEGNPEKYVMKIKENLHLLPAEDMLATFSRYIYTNKFRQPMQVLKNTMEEIESNYDYILMDCPPNIGDLVLNAVVYADYCIIPAQCEAFGIDALDRFVKFLSSAKEEGHTNIELLGILLTLRESRVLSEKVIADTIRRTYGELVFQTEIKRKARIKDYALMGVTMDKKADLNALEDYMLFVQELINRVEKRRIEKAAGGNEEK